MLEDTALLAGVDDRRRPRASRTRGGFGALVGCFWAAGIVATLGLSRARVPSGDRAAPSLASDAAASSAVRVQVFYAGADAYSHAAKNVALLRGALAAGVSFDERAMYASLADVLAARPPAGSVVAFNLVSELATGGGTTGELGSVDQRCAYQHSASSPLLLSPDVMKLLAYERPLTLVETSDWGCRARFPPTIHNVYRNSYGAGGNASDGGGGGGGGGGRAGPMAHAAFFPYGVEYGEVDEIGDFLLRANASRGRGVAARDVALAFAGTINARKPVRVYVNETMHRGGALAAMRALARARGLDVIFQETQSGEHHGRYDASGEYAYQSAYGMTYFDLLARSRLYLSVAGDAWVDGNVWEALEFGAIPVVEDRASYKGCDDPAGWFKQHGAPLLYVKDWAELPAVLAAALADDDALERRRQALGRWWAGKKAEIGAQIAGFARQYAAADDAALPANDCASTALSDEQATRFAQVSAAFYAQEHWYENFADSPWLVTAFCSKAAKLGFDGDACFSPACAPPAVASFGCGGVTISAAPPVDLEDVTPPAPPGREAEADDGVATWNDLTPANPRAAAASERA